VIRAELELKSYTSQYGHSHRGREVVDSTTNCAMKSSSHEGQYRNVFIEKATMRLL
jgi:hypothetical protein